MSETKIGEQQPDYGFGKFLEKEKDRFQVSQRVISGLTLVELRGISHDQDIDAVLLGDKLVGIREKGPDSINVTLLGDKMIKTYRRLKAGRLLSVGVANGVDYLTHEYVLGEESDFAKIFHLSEWPVVGVLYTIKDGAGFGPELRINSAAFNFERSVAVFPKKNRIWFGAEEKELPASNGGKVYSMSKSPGLFSVWIENPGGKEAYVFPEFVGRKDLIDVDNLLGSDIDWINLPRIKPHFLQLLKTTKGAKS